MNWKTLYFGKVTRVEVQEAVTDPEWQELRKEMKGRPLGQKYQMLRTYYFVTRDNLKRTYLDGGYAHLPVGAYEHDKRLLEVRCTNYVTALARGGLIKKEDYQNV